ncbi:MAG: hypothetical protein IIA89_07090 [Chloroflexi bacterium]|nr:hypothetical protein [Chloroflexota bacterium]
MSKDTKGRLQLIVEKAEKLRRFGLEKHVEEVGLGFHAERQADDSWQIDLGFPDEEKRDAFVLTFRFFHQHNEPISFHQISNLATDPTLSNHWKEEAARLKETYFEYLDGRSEYTVNLFEGQPTRGLMLDLGLYGGLAHANRPEKVQQFREWTRDEVRAGLFEQEFARILVRVLQLIYELAEVSRQELKSDAA